MMRVAGANDVPALEAFLRPHAATSMFLRGNLASHGEQNQTHPHGTTYFLWERQGRLTAVLGITNGGYLMCQAPNMPEGFIKATTAALRGRQVQGITGRPEQVTPLIEALGLAPQDFAMDVFQPLYALALTDLRPPTQSSLSLRRPTEADQSWLTPWMARYHADTGLPPPHGASYDGLAAGFIAKLDARLLYDRDIPVAMGNFNARTADMVQVGGIFLPPEHRGNGWGGAIVALQLAEARSQGIGIETAILFAASKFAASAYEHIGFRRVGDYQIALLTSPYQVPA